MTISPNPILLQDLLHLTSDERARAKVKFNIYNGHDNPIEVFKRDPETLNNQWLFWNKKRKYTPMSNSCTVILTVPHKADESSPVRKRHRK